MTSHKDDYVNQGLRSLRDVRWDNVVPVLGGVIAAGHSTGDPTPTASAPLDMSGRHSNSLQWRRWSEKQDGRKAVVRVRARSSSKAQAHKERGSGSCEGCGWAPPEKRILHAHHVVPLACGGVDEAKNWVVVCPNCHALAHYACPREGRKYRGPRSRAGLLAVVAALREGIEEKSLEKMAPRHRVA